MAITFINSTSNSSFSPSTNVNRPSGTQAGDVLIATVSSNQQNIQLPSGWQFVNSEDSGVMRSHLCYKVLGESEPGSYTFSFNNETILIVGITAWRGVNNANPIHNDSAINNSSNTTNYTTPSVSVSSAPVRLIYFRQSRASVSTPRTFSTGASGVTKRYDLGSNVSNTSYAMAGFTADSDHTSTGTASGITISVSGSVTNNIARTVALEAAPGADYESQTSAALDVDAATNTSAQLPSVSQAQAQAQADTTTRRDRFTSTSVEAQANTDSDASAGRTTQTSAQAQVQATTEYEAAELQVLPALVTELDFLMTTDVETGAMVSDVETFYTDTDEFTYDTETEELTPDTETDTDNPATITEYEFPHAETDLGSVVAETVIVEEQNG